MNVGVQRPATPIHGNWRAVAGRFFLIFVIALAVGAGVIAFIDYQRFAASRSARILAEQDLVEAAGQILSHDLEQTVTRPQAIRRWSSVRNFAANPTPDRREVVEREFLTVARSSSTPGQLRVLDLSGRELIRVVSNAGTPMTVSPANLRNLSDEAYVQKLQQLQPDDVHVSVSWADFLGPAPGPQADSWELRVASLLLDRQGSATGILILDYFASDLLQRFDASLGGSWGLPMLLSNEGIWLAGDNFQEQPLSAAGPAGSFAVRFPNAWQHIHGNDSGRITTSSGHFTFTTLTIEHMQAEGDSLSWKLLSWVPVAQFRYAPLRDLSQSWAIYLLLILVAAPVSLLIAWQRTSNLAQRRALAVSEERLTLAFQGANDAMWDWDVAKDRVYFSHRFKDMLGHGAEQFIDEGRFWFQQVHPDDKAQVQAAIADYLEGRTSHYSTRFRLRHRDGRYIWVQARGGGLRDHAGAPLRMVGVLTDITEQVVAEDKLRQAAAVFENTSEAILTAGADGRIQAVNAAFTRITGYTPDEAIGRHVRLLGIESEEPDFLERIDESVRTSGYWRGEARLRRKNGELFPVWQNVTGVHDDAGRLRYYVAILTDISPIKESEERLAYLAHHDALTGLPNRLRFLASLEQTLRRAERHGQCAAVMFLDLDRFKSINDTLGHAAGDSVLKAVAERLRASVRDEDMVARLAGDEFVVVLEEIGGPADAREPAEKIIQAIRQPIVVLEDQQITTSTSIGISIYPHDGRTNEDLIRAADAAMYQAKQEGRNIYRYFTPAFRDVARERLAIERDLRTALADGQFFLCYQPQVSMATGEISGVEALLRWRHPQRGVLLPESFMGIADASGLSEPLGEWVLQEAVAQACRWRRASLRLAHLAINLSPRQILSRHLLGKLKDVMTAHRPGGPLRLDLEISEPALEDAADSLARLCELKELGVRLAIDGFGTGQSSLTVLRRLPIDTIKLDRSLTAGLPHDRVSSAIASAAIGLAQTLRIQVSVTGVEREEQLRFIRDQGCHEAQGYLFSEALEAAGIESLLRSRRRWQMPATSSQRAAKH